MRCPVRRPRPPTPPMIMKRRRETGTSFSNGIPTTPSWPKSGARSPLRRPCGGGHRRGAALCRTPWGFGGDADGTGQGLSGGQPTGPRRTRLAPGREHGPDGIGKFCRALGVTVDYQGDHVQARESLRARPGPGRPTTRPSSTISDCPRRKADNWPRRGPPCAGPSTCRRRAPRFARTWRWSRRFLATPRRRNACPDKDLPADQRPRQHRLFQPTGRRPATVTGSPPCHWVRRRLVNWSPMAVKVVTSVSLVAEKK